jgi:hypothetical protein
MHGRRKTVIAGTFAIASNSLSNAHPISVAQTPLQSAMTQTQSIDEGFSRVACHIPGSSLVATARSSQECAGRVLRWRSPRTSREGKLVDRPPRSCFAPEISPFFLSETVRSPSNFFHPVRL